MTCASDPLCHFCNLTYDRCECRLAALKSPPIGGEGERSPAQFFFEVGFGACWAEAFVKNAGTPPFPLTDAAVERAWSIAGEAHDDPAEFDRYLALASSTEGERTHWPEISDEYLAAMQRQIDTSRPANFELTEIPTTSGDVGKLCERLLSEVRFLKTLTDADIERSGTMESTMVRAGLLSEILTAFEAQAARIAALEKALEPSLETKVEYIGEVRETLTMRDEDGEEYSYQHTISWDAIKDIMNMIRTYADECTARALLNPTPTEEGDHERASR